MDDDINKFSTIKPGDPHSGYIFSKKNNSAHYKKWAVEDILPEINSNYGKIRENAIQTAKIRQIEVINKTEGKTAEEVLKLFDELESQDGLTQIMEGIAIKMQEVFDKTLAEKGKELLSYKKLAIKSAGFLSSENGVNIQQLNAFCIAIEEAVKLINGGKVPQELFDAFAQFYDGNKRIYQANEDTIIEVQKIIKYLNNAYDRWFSSKSNTVSFDSIVGTIQNIFSGAVGERLILTVVQNSLLEDVNIDKIFEDIKFSNPNIRITKAIKGENSQAILTGAMQQDNATSKIDVLANNLLNLSVEINGKTLNFALNPGLSVKWASAKTNGNTLPSIHVVNNASMSLIRQKLVDKHGQSLVYDFDNVFAHYQNNQKVFNATKEFLAGSFINDWIAGSGQQIITNRNDLADFLIINGKVIPTIKVISAVVEQALPTAPGSGFNNESIALKLGNINAAAAKNDWIVDKETKNKSTWSVDEAIERSNAVREAINTITIGLTLNSNFISDLLPKTI